MPFVPACEPMKVLAGLEVPAKAIERAAESIGKAIARSDVREIDRAKHLVLPMVSRLNIPRMYVLMDGVRIPVGAAETEGKSGRIEGQRARTRECKLGAVFTQTTVDKDGWPIRDPDSTSYIGAAETADELGYRLHLSLEQGLGVGYGEDRHWRRSRLDLEPGRSALPRSRADRRPLSHAATPLGCGYAAPSTRCGGE